MREENNEELPAAQAPPESSPSQEQGPQQERAAELPPAGEPDPREMIRQQLETSDAEERAREYDVRELARALDSIRYICQADEEKAQEIIRKFLEGPNSYLPKDERDRAGEIAEELSRVDARFARHFQGEIQKEAVADTAAKSEKQQSRIDRAGAAVREGLFSIVLGGALSADKLSSLVGKISFKREPGEEIEGEGVAIEKGEILAYCAIERGEEGASFNIYFYEPFLRGLDSEDEEKTNQLLSERAHIVRHEISHILVEGSDLWKSEELELFYALAKNSQESEGEERLPKELRGLLQILREPGKHKGLWSGYIGKLIEAQAGEPDNPQKRLILAREMLAEMVSAYLAGGKSFDSYLGERLRFASPDELQVYLKKALGDDFDRVLADRDINLSEIESLEDLSDIPELYPLLGLNRDWHEAMLIKFADRGEGITPLRDKETAGIAEIESEWNGVWYDDSYYPSFSSAREDGGVDARGGASSEKDNPLLIIWNFLTGNKEEGSGALRRAA